MTIRKILTVVGGVIVVAGIYLGAIEYWAWKWESPHIPLPNQHLKNHDLATINSTGKNWSADAQQRMIDLAEQMQSVSMSGAMTVNGKVVWAGAVGLARVEPEQTASVNSQYRIGSVSKPVTAVTLMRMVEEGKINLDESIHTYLPNYPRYSSDITPRQLVSHMAGVRHYSLDFTNFPPTDGLSNIAYPDVNAALIQFKDDDLLFEPGKGFKYSTHGYTLLSAVMQAAGAKPFDELVTRLVTRPVGMNNTSPEHLLTDTSHLAGFCTSDGGLYGITPVQNLSNKVAGGGFVSTPSDLVLMGASLLKGELLMQESFDEMVEVQPMHDGSDHPQYYALGWRHYKTQHILDKENKVDVIHHGGVAQGADSFLLLVPEYDISVAILTNGQGDKSRGEIQMLAYRLAGMVIRGQQEDAFLNSKESNM